MGSQLNKKAATGWWYLDVVFRTLQNVRIKAKFKLEGRLEERIVHRVGKAVLIESLSMPTDMRRLLRT